ncbi:hypothetical protein [Wolbachia endosymbiont of Corcyra cephalonica]
MIKANIANTQAIVIKSLNSLLKDGEITITMCVLKKRLERSTMKFGIVYGNGQRKDILVKDTLDKESLLQ